MKISTLLYEHPLSSYAQKDEIALLENGVPFDVELPGSFGRGRTEKSFAAADPCAELLALVGATYRFSSATPIIVQNVSPSTRPTAKPRTNELLSATCAALALAITRSTRNEIIDDRGEMSKSDIVPPQSAVMRALSPQVRSSFRHI